MNELDEAALRIKEEGLANREQWLAAREIDVADFANLRKTAAFAALNSEREESVASMAENCFTSGFMQGFSLAVLRREKS